MWAPAIAAAAELVTLPGIGEVPLEDALATCEKGAPQGAVAAAEGPRVPAFAPVIEALVATDDRMRTGFFQHRTTWPSDPTAYTYVPTTALDWWPRGVAAACHQAGLEMVRRGTALRTTCNEGRAACRDALPDDGSDIAKEALKLWKPEGRRDPMLALLGEAGAGGFVAPGPLLERACALPGEAGGAHRFIDVDDLEAARGACLQLLRLLEGRPPELERRVWCDTRWTREAEAALTELPTDLGTLSSDPVMQVETVLDHLLRADPEALACNWPAGAAWRRLDDAWRAAQQSAACADEALPLDQRAQLCPGLDEQLASACSEGDFGACHAAARMLADGVGRDADEDAALRQWLVPCQGGHTPSCEALASRTDAITAWLEPAFAQLADEAKALAPPPAADPPEAEAETETEAETGEAPDADQDLAITDARQVIADHAPHLDADWAPTQRRRLLEAALEAQRRALATELLEALRDHLEADEIAAYDEALEALPAPDADG